MAFNNLLGFVSQPNQTVIEEHKCYEKEGYFYPLILTNPMEVVYENE